jgi:hypothetical protein
MYNAGAETFEYTEAVFPDSSLVNGIYYDENDRELMVALDGGYGYCDNLYVYKDVDKGTFQDFVSSNSKGGFYNTEIKGKHTSQSLGDACYTDTQEVPVEVAAPVFATGGPVTPSYTSLRTVPEVRGDLGFTPKALKDNTPDNVVPLKAPAPEVTGTRRWTVSFTVEGREDVKTYPVEAANVVEAVEAVGQVAEMLGVSVDVVGVVLAN